MAEVVEESVADLGFGPRQEVSGQGFEIAFGPSGAQANAATTKISGWQFQRSNEKGPIEIISLENNTLAYEVGEYVRWENFYERFLAGYSKAFSEVTHFAELSSLTLEYQDRFVFVGEPETSNPNEIVPLTEIALPTGTASEGNLWHMHRGWFQPWKFGKLLVHSNFDAQDGRFYDQRARSVAVLTKAEARSNLNVLDGDSLTTHIPIMHDVTNSVMSEALSEFAKDLIGLD